MREFASNVAPHATNSEEGRPARLPEIESVKIIVVFHNSATIVVAISLLVCAPFFSGFLRISACNKP
ncbi:hypothetical protein BLAT2472_140052 [Burkholderia latens]